MSGDAILNCDILPDYWKKIYISAKRKSNNTENKYLVEYLFNEYLLKGYLSEYSFKDILEIDDKIILEVFVKLYLMNDYKSCRPGSIIESEENTDWMKSRDYCFVNIRALGSEVEETGDIISAAKLLLLLRTTGIHLAPFFECSEGIIYCQKSFYKINHEIINKFYLDNGVTDIEQLKFFIDCCHLLKMAVGFDVAPHTSYDSALRLEHPELFRWIKLTQDKSALDSVDNIDVQYSDKFQKKYQKAIREIVNKFKNEKNVRVFETFEDNVSSHVLSEINKKIMDEGFYTVPPHTWNGISVPGFKRYSYGLGRPVWEYLDKYAQSQGEHAIALHANFYIHIGMLANRIQNTEKEIIKNKEFFEFYKKYIKEVVDIFLFDFVRFDYVDHIFDNVLYDDNKEIPLNEMVTPTEILDIISFLRIEYPALGLQADHIGTDTQNYEKAGVNLIIDPIVKFEYDSKTMVDIIHSIGKYDNSYCVALWGIDTQDIAHPLFLGKELPLREGKVGVIVRFFMSRFVNIGKNRKPRYEVIGNQDMSFGIHRTNNRPESLTWRSDMEVMGIYHKIENVYHQIRKELEGCTIGEVSVCGNMIVYTFLNNSIKSFWIGIMPIPVSKNSLDSKKIIISCKNIDYNQGFPILHSMICYEISDADLLNEATIEKICSIEYKNVLKEFHIMIKNRALALIEVKKE